MAGGFRTILPFGVRGLILSGGVITPVNPLTAISTRPRTVISGLDIRGEIQRVRVASPGSFTLQEVRLILTKALDALQANADIQDERFRQLSGTLNTVGLVRDPSGNIVFSGNTFTVRAGSQQFSLALGGMLFGIPNNPPNDGLIPQNHGTWYIDELTNELKMRVRYSDGTLKTATIPLV